MKNRAGFLAVAAMLLTVSASAFAQSSLPHFAVGAKASTLGVGFEGATAVTSSSNVRAGFNLFNYSRTFTKDGVNYNAELQLRSLQVTWDQYLFGGFHVSPGLLAYDGNEVHATATVPPGQSFSLDGTRYFSNPSNPITGTGKVDLRKTAPMVLVGVGNLLPRNGRHFGFNIETGVVFQGSPATTLNLSGSACIASPTVGCRDVATDPTVQSNVQGEQQKLNDDLKPFKYFPVVSIGVSWKF